MKIDFSQELVGLGGKPLKWGKDDPETGEQAATATLEIVCIEALLRPAEGQRGTSADEKLKRWKLAQSIHQGGEVEVTAEDIVLLKNAINTAFDTIVVGPAYALLTL